MRFLVCTTPLDGHFRPMIPLARALQERGHEVAVATNEGWHGHVVSEGFEALPAGRRHEAAWEHVATVLGDAIGPALEHRGDEVFALLFAEGHADVKAPELVEVARAWVPDAIVFESADLAGPPAAAALGVPAVHHSWGPLLPRTWFEAAAVRVRPAWRHLGLAAPPLAGVFSGLYVDLAPAVFQRERPPAERIGMRPAPAGSDQVPAWVRTLEPPLVYVTLGTLFNDPELLRTIVDGLDGLGSAVVTTGRDVDPAALGPVPAHVHVEQFLPQSQVLPCAAAAVGHGGAGSTLGALAHGVPLVLLPMGADQFHVADFAASAGAAVVVRPEARTPAGVRDALARVLADEPYRRGAQAVQRDIDAMPTPAAAAARVEEYVVRSRPEPLGPS